MLKFMLTILKAVTEMESEQTVERIREGVVKEITAHAPATPSAGRHL